MMSHIDVYAAYVASLHRDDMKWYASRYNPYTLSAFLKDNLKSSIGHANLNIKKYIPATNWFYIVLIVLFTVSLIFAFRRYHI